MRIRERELQTKVVVPLYYMKVSMSDDYYMRAQNQTNPGLKQLSIVSHVDEWAFLLDIIRTHGEDYELDKKRLRMLKGFIHNLEAVLEKGQVSSVFSKTKRLDAGEGDG